MYYEDVVYVYIKYLGWNKAVHENDIRAGHDLVVMTMSRSVENDMRLTNQIRPACLPVMNYNPSGKIVFYFN